MEKNNFLQVAQYLKKVTESYADSKSMTDIYDQFRCMSREYEEFNEEQDDQELYTSLTYNECTRDEQQRYLDTVMSMIPCLITNSI